MVFAGKARGSGVILRGRGNMTERTDGGFAPSIADMEFEQLWTWWSETYGIAPSAARWLALYQYGGGNALGGLINRADPFDTEFHYAERPIC